jgi:hypothetical protein
MAQPAEQLASSLRRQNQSFLDQLRIDYGPIALLGLYFARVAETVTRLDIGLSVEPVSRLMDINGNNRESWRPLFPAFNPDYNALDETNSFSLIAYDIAGEPVASGACRLYDWTSTNYHDELESLRMLRASREAQSFPFESCVVSAASARNVTGRIAFAGAAWCHPKVRGKSLSSIIPRTSKALALAKWDFDNMVGLMVEDSLARGLGKRFGYASAELGALFRTKDGGAINYALLAMPREDVVEHVRGYLAGQGSQVDSVIDRRLA